jgi:hypothetical protein
VGGFTCNSLVWICKLAYNKIIASNEDNLKFINLFNVIILMQIKFVYMVYKKIKKLYIYIVQIILGCYNYNLSCHQFIYNYHIKCQNNLGCSIYTTQKYPIKFTNLKSFNFCYWFLSKIF